MRMPPWLTRLPHWPRSLTRLPLAVEITLALLIKILILTLLWKAFFAAPQTRKMRMPTTQVEQHFLAPTPSKPSATRRNTGLQAGAVSQADRMRSETPAAPSRIFPSS